MSRRLKKPVIYSLYGLSFLALFGGLFLVDFNNNKLNNNNDNDHQFVSKSVLKDSEVPVVNTSDIMIRPYNDADVSVLTSYYDYKATEDEQKKSIIYYENTYIPSNGVSYGKDSEFDVIAVLDGTVKSVKEDENLGNVITIEHDNGSVKNIVIKDGDTVKKGDIIAKSSTSNVEADKKNHIYFEIIVNNSNVNPESCFDKTVNEISA